MSSISRISPAEELAEFLARRPSLAEIATFRLSDAALERARELMDKNVNGALSAEESRELDRLALLDDIIGLIHTHVEERD
jgi:hypothetical protein